MNNSDKLQAIKARCYELIESVSARVGRDKTIISSYSDASIAGCRATIAVVDHLMEIHKLTPLEDYAPWAVELILAAWEGQV